MPRLDATVAPTTRAGSEKDLRLLRLVMVHRAAAFLSLLCLTQPSFLHLRATIDELQGIQSIAGKFDGRVNYRVPIQLVIGTALALPTPYVHSIVQVLNS